MVPRVRCATCAKTTQIAVPWARPNSGFPPLMEALIVTLCQAMPIRAVAQVLGVGDLRRWRTLDNYVAGARAQEDCSAVAAVGLDETAARRGHHSISRFHDLDAGRLLFACEGRKAEVVAPFADDLEAHGGCAENVRNACIDRSASYRSGLAEHRPGAAVTCDEFHVIPRVNQAVDEVRRQEAKSTPSLKRRYLWLQDQRAWTGPQIAPFADLKQLNLKTPRASHIKERLREIFRGAPHRGEAEPLLNQWYSWARRCRLDPIQPVAKTLKDHWAGILHAFDSQLTTGRVEGANALVQAAKAQARGYGTVRHLITIAYRVAGNLTHLPASPFKRKACAMPSS